MKKRVIVSAFKWNEFDTGKNGVQFVLTGFKEAERTEKLL